MVRVKSVDVLHGFCVRLAFTDGTCGDLDLRPYLRGPIFEPLVANRALFASVRVDPEVRTIVWANGADMDPDVLYELTHPTAGRER